MDDIRIEIGERIRELRHELKMSQRDLAAKAGVSPTNIANIELGKYSVGLDVLNRITGALGCHVCIKKKSRKG